MMTPTATVFVIDDHEAVRKSHPLPSHLIWLGVPVAQPESLGCQRQSLAHRSDNEPSRSIQSVPEFLLRVHHDRALLGDGLIERPSRHGASVRFHMTNVG